MDKLTEVLKFQNSEVAFTPAKWIIKLYKITDSSGVYIVAVVGGVAIDTSSVTRR